MEQVKEPRQKARLSEPFSLRLRPTEKEQVEELAQRLDVSLSDAGRIVFRRGLESPERMIV
jgi:hypothetical protein